MIYTLIYEIILLMKEKGFTSPLIIIGSIVIMGLIGGIYYFGKARTSTPQSQKSVATSQSTNVSQPTATSSSQAFLDYTKDWGIYTNKLFYFTFKYPKDWKLDVPSLEGIHPSNKTLLQINLTNPSYDKNKILSPDLGGPGDHPSDPDKDPYAITFRVWDNKEEKSLREKIIEIDNFFQNSQQGFCVMLPISDDIKEHQRCVKNASGLGMNEKIITAGKYIYLISGGPINSRADYKFKQIIDTFKLTQ